MGEGVDLSLADAADALDRIDPHDRDTWIRMGMALKSEFGDAAYETWDAWSATASNYSSREARTQWRSLKEHGRVSIGTLIHEAKEAGWQPPRRELTETERREREEQRRQRQRERREQAEAQAERERYFQERVASLARGCWDELGSVGRSPYLGAKRVGAHGIGFAKHGLLLTIDEPNDAVELIRERQRIQAFFDERPQASDGFSFRYLRPGTIAVPMRDVAGDLWGLQLIFQGGAKKFLRGGRKRGTFHLIGGRPDYGQRWAVAEGYATAATIHEATGWPVVVTWDAANMLAVANELAAAGWPMADAVFCGDDDHEATDGEGRPLNKGREYARRAAGESGGLTAFPQFEEPAGRTDWNDLQLEQGQNVVREQLEAAVAAGGHGADDGDASGGGDDGPPPDDEEPPPPDPDEVPNTPGSPPASGDWEWLDELNRNAQYCLKATLHNVITILERDPRWAGLFALDEFANEIRRTRQTPYGREAGSITDTDGTETAAWFGHPQNYGLSISSGMALEAIEAVATRNKFHPVRDYLDSLEWDGQPRLEHWLCDYLGVVQSEYSAAVGKNWLVAAVNRVRNPGCKVDTMVILEGDQGRGKSTAVRMLCGPMWFAEMLESPQNKDFFQVLTGRWFVEIPELQAFNKADRNKIKAAVSAQEDTYRPSYGRYARQFPRQCVFVGTTNDDTYLKDETGARRFWPVRCGQINLKRLSEVVDQLWAEADYRAAQGERYWEVPESALEEQEARFDADAWEEPIMEWLDGGCSHDRYPMSWSAGNGRPVDQVQLSEVMEWALRLEIGKHSRPEQMRVSAIMRRLGWRRVQRRNEYNRRVWVYERPEEANVA